MAEQVVAVVAQDMTHAARFLRVDMVARRDGTGWWVNELEFFGNASIHLEAFDNSNEMLDRVAQCLLSWVSARAVARP